MNTNVASNNHPHTTNNPSKANINIYKTYAHQKHIDNGMNESINNNRYIHQYQDVYNSPSFQMNQEKEYYLVKLTKKTYLPHQQKLLPNAFLLRQKLHIIIIDKQYIQLYNSLYLFAASILYKNQVYCFICLTFAGIIVCHISL